MINKIENIQKNLLIKQMNNSDAIAYNRDFLKESTDANFDVPLLFRFID